MSDKKECPVCGKSVSPQGFGNHKDSKKCLMNAKGKKLFDSTLVSGDRAVHSKCVVCGGKIDGEEDCLRIKKISHKGMSETLVSYICSDCLNIEYIYANALKEG